MNRIELTAQDMGCWICEKGRGGKDNKRLPRQKGIQGSNHDEHRGIPIKRTVNHPHNMSNSNVTLSGRVPCVKLIPRIISLL